MATIEDVRGINNPQMNYEWEVEILGPSTGGETALTTHAQSVTIPEVSSEVIELNFKSDKTSHAGRNASPRTTTVTFFDDEDLTVYRFLKNWKSLINNESTGGGVNRPAYVANIVIRQFARNSEDVVANHTLIGAWLTTVGDVSLNYDSSEVMTVEATFNFQRHITD